MAVSNPVRSLFEDAQSQQYSLHERHLNEQLVRVLRTTGYDRVYARGEGAYLWDTEGQRYLDLLAGFGVHAFGRNHPVMKERLKQAIDEDLPNLVQLDCPALAGAFASRLAPRMPNGLNRFFFCNSGTEAIEGAIKMSRATTGRAEALYTSSAYHGLSLGALALNGCDAFRENFGPLPNATEIPFDDLGALEKALSTKRYACFVVEPIQGKGVHIPSDDYLPEASRLCKKHGTLLVIDEVQTGIGRTGKFLAVEHWPGTEPDIVTMAKALSGGFIPVGAIATSDRVFARTFPSMERAVVHSTTFGRNALAMVAGITSLEILDEGDYIRKSAERGAELLAGLRDAIGDDEFVKDVRGKGLMVGVEFGPPKSMKLKLSWGALESANKGLFAQLIVIPLFRDHHMLTQVAGNASHVVKMIPPLTLSSENVSEIVAAYAEVVEATHRVPGAIWDLGKTLASAAMRTRKAG